MKITRKRDFTPVYIKLESQKEVDLLYAVFNFVPIMDCIRREVNGLPTKLHDGLHEVKSDNTITYSNLLRNGLTSI